MTHAKIAPRQSLSLLEKVYVYGLVLIFGLIVLHAPLTVFAGSHFGHALIFKAWKELVMGGLLLIAAVILTQRQAWSSFIRDPLIIASGALALLYIISVGYGHGASAYGAGLLIDLRYILYAVLVYVSARLFSEARPLMIRVGLIGAIVVIGFGLLQFVLPKDFLSVFGYSQQTITPYTTVDSDENLPRLQSTLRGPNPLGAYALIVALIAGAAAARSATSRRIRGGAAVLALLAVVVLTSSYSRSAFIGLAIGGVITAAVVGARKFTIKRVVAGVFIGVLVIVGCAIALRPTHFYQSVVEHNVVGSGPAVDSNAGHGRSLVTGLADIVTHPLGYGTGSTGSASLLGTNGYIVENQYLYVAHEAGWLGLGLFVFIIGTLLRRAWRRRADPFALGVFTSGIGLLVVGLLLPVFADDTVSIVWFGLAALVAGTTVSARQEKDA